MSPNREPAHRGGVAGGDHALQTVGLAVIRLVIAWPSSGECAGSIKSAAGEKNPILAKSAGHGLVVLHCVTVLHLEPGAAVTVDGCCRNVWSSRIGVYRLTVVGFEAANRGFHRRIG